MWKNEGLVDRIIRAVIGVGIIGLGVGLLQNNVVLLSVYVVIGLMLVVTAAVGFCPLYRLFRFNTFPKYTYQREAPPEKPWKYKNVQMMDSRVQKWGRSEGRTSLYRSETSGGRQSKWGSGSEARAASNRSAYRSASTGAGKKTWGESSEDRVAKDRATFRK